MHRRVAEIALIVGIMALATGCGPSRPTRHLNVFAAASLAAPFGEISVPFAERNPGIVVNPQFAGSQILLAQLRQGARADVLATASPHEIEKARQLGLVAGEPQVFARNRVAIITSIQGPTRVSLWTDLARTGVRLAIAAPAVPAGAYARDVIAKLAALPEAGPDFARRVLANVVSEDEDVAGVAGKVMLGEVDAGLVYATDALGKDVLTVDVPANVEAEYVVAVLAGSGDRALAQAYVAELLGSDGQSILRRHGFVPVR